MTRRMRRALFLAIFLLLGMLAGFAAFAFKVERQTIQLHQKADGMIVLTGGADRIPDAIELFSKGHANRMLITGVNPGITRAEIGRFNPRYRELIDCCVDLGYEALNTSGNAREARRWAEQNAIHQSLIVVTSNYHMPRALAELHDALPGLALIPYPVVSVKMRDSSWWQSPQAMRLIGSEYIKYIFVSGRILSKKLWSQTKAILD
jgi:uncharacterized SAM-binding protein YcdF (DUF218 family)